MNAAPCNLKVAPLFRAWDDMRRQFSFSDLRPKTQGTVDRWTGLYDKEGTPIYEKDILSVHYNWRLGWVRAVVEAENSGKGFIATLTGPGGEVFRVGSFSFSDSYVEGNVHLNPQRLIPAQKQFPEPIDFIKPGGWSDDIFTPFSRDGLN